MIFTETPLAGAWIIQPEPKHDERGFFARTFCKQAFRERGLCTDFAQCSVSHNNQKSLLRGMHWQVAPHGENARVRSLARFVSTIAMQSMNRKNRSMYRLACGSCIASEFSIRTAGSAVSLSSC